MMETKRLFRVKLGPQQAAPTTSWISAEGRSLSSSEDDRSLLPGNIKNARSQTISVPAWAQECSVMGGLPNASREKVAEAAQCQDLAEPEPEAEEEDETLRAAAALDAMRSPEKRSKQRASNKMGIPIDECGPLETAAERALFFMVYQDPACKNSDGSDNFLVMSGKFNCHYSSQIVARAAGQTVAPHDIINMTNVRRMEEFTDYMIRLCDLVDALPVKPAASLHDLRASGEQVRQNRIQVRRLQKQQAEAHAAASGAPAMLQPIYVSSKRKRGGVGISKKCSACGLHKSKDTGHAKTTCPTHCLTCKQEWQDPKQKTGCSCPVIASASAAAGSI